MRSLSWNRCCDLASPLRQSPGGKAANAMSQDLSQPVEQVSNPESIASPELRRRHGALGKALIVWLASGSFLAAVAAYFLFGAMGC